MSVRKRTRKWKSGIERKEEIEKKDIEKLSNNYNSKIDDGRFNPLYGWHIDRPKDFEKITT
jgi:hypothetical protein